MNGKPLALSAMEYKMLNLFLKNPKQVLTRQQFLEKLWDVDEKYVDEHTLTTSISRIFAVRLKRMATHISKRFMVWGINGQEAKRNESE